VILDVSIELGREGTSSAALRANTIAAVALIAGVTSTRVLPKR
jgi:hypothetical protein